MSETWETIQDFPKYSVSTQGRIRNDSRGRVVRPSRTIQGDLKVGLIDECGHQRTRSVKVIVAETFVRGREEFYDVPIHLDGDQTNVSADNILWRPVGFAWKYKQQFAHAHEFTQYGPLVSRKTGEVYDNVVTASIANGYLFREVLYSVVNKTPVVPGWDIFDWWKG